jgi:hypothetical protein
MSAGLRQHVSTIVISILVAALFASVPAVAAIVNATFLNGYKANEIIRVSRNSKANDALVSDGTRNAVVIRTRISAPHNGYLFIVSSSDVYNGPDVDTCALTVDGNLLFPSKRTFSLTADNDEGNCNTDIAVPVAEGRHTVALVAMNPAAGVTYDEATIEVIYTPFGKTGRVPVADAPAPRTSG